MLNSKQWSRSSALERFGSGPAVLQEALRKCPQRMWLYRRAPGSSSIHERIVLLADIEAQNYVLCRQFICAPRIAMTMYDPVTAVKKLCYWKQSARKALALIVRLREASHRLLSSLPSPVWAHSIDFSYEGTVTLETWLERQARYTEEQAEQIRETYVTWLSNNPPLRRAVVGSSSERALT